MAKLGSAASIHVSAAGSVWTKVGGLNSIDFESGYESADVGEFGDVAARKLPTLSTFKGSASGQRDIADAGQAIIKTAQNGRTLLFVKVMEDATNGYSAQCALGPSKVGAKQGNEAVSFSFDFEIAGGVAPTAIP